MPFKTKEQQADYARSHYKNNKEYYNKKRIEHRNKIRDYIKEAKNIPCTDCGIKYPYYVMQFDHLSDKEFGLNYARQKGLGIERVKAEIAKCEVVCANCHAERTWGGSR